MFSLSSALCGNTGFFPGESLRNSRRRSRNLWNSFRDVHAQLKQQTVAAIPASLASDDSHPMLQDGTKIIIIPCLPFHTWAGSSFPDSKNSLRNSRTLAIKAVFSTDFPHLRPQCIYCNTVTDQDYVIIGHSTTLNFYPPWTHHVAFVLPSVSVAACCSLLNALLPFCFFFFWSFLWDFFFTCAPSPVSNRAVFGNVRVGLYVPQNTC